MCWISKAALHSPAKTISSMRFSCFSPLSVCSNIAKTEMLTMMGSRKREMEKEIVDYKKPNKQ